LYIDGEKPPERRVWTPEYGYIGTSLSGRENSSAPSATQPSSRASVVAMSAVLALLVVCIIVGIIFQRQPPATPPLVAPTPVTHMPQPLPVPPMHPVADVGTPPAATADGGTAAAMPGTAIQMPGAVPPE